MRFRFDFFFPKTVSEKVLYISIKRDKMPGSLLFMMLVATGVVA